MHEAEDEVRFTLTSEGGLNDALAFPFVYLAIRLAEGGTPHGVIAGWLAWDLGWRVAVGVVVGVGVGRLVGVVAFRPPGPLTALAETPQGFLAVATTLIAYGATEILHGYGFWRCSSPRSHSGLGAFPRVPRRPPRVRRTDGEPPGGGPAAPPRRVAGQRRALRGVVAALAIAMAVVLLLQAGQRTAGLLGSS